MRQQQGARSVYIVKVNADRPDFRVFLDLLYERGHEIDTSGNCRFPEDTSWTDFFIQDRESDRPPIRVHIPEQYWDDDDNCLEYIFHVESDDSIALEAVAILLFDYCGNEIADENRQLTEADCDVLRERHAVLLDRARQSSFYSPPQMDA